MSGFKFRVTNCDDFLGRFVCFNGKGDFLSPEVTFRLAQALDPKSGKSESKCGRQEARGRSLIERINYFSQRTSWLLQAKLAYITV